MNRYGATGFDSFVDLNRYWHHQYQGNTNDCGAYSVAIVASTYHKGVPLYDGAQVALDMEQKHRKLSDSASFPWGMAAQLRDYDVPATWRMFMSWRSVEQRVMRGDFVIMIIGSIRERWAHAMVVYGFQPSLVYFMDPANEKQITVLSKESVVRQWTALGRIAILSPGGDLPLAGG